MANDSKNNNEKLKALKALPLEQKIFVTKKRIKEWADHWGEDNIYVSFSGGKDSTVLLDIVRSMYPNTKAMFIDTGLEYPEIREFVRSFENVDWVKPKLDFRSVIDKYGYPFISKEVSECVAGARRFAVNYHLKCREIEGTSPTTSSSRNCSALESTEIPITHDYRFRRLLGIGEFSAGGGYETL